jgi:hypothetical protein
MQVVRCGERVSGDDVPTAVDKDVIAIKLAILTPSKHPVCLLTHRHFLRLR